MEELLRNCYKEMNIWGANALTFEKRKDAITDILKNNILNKREYRSLTDWLMGIEEKPEDILIKLEKVFCEYDEKFTLQGEEFQGEENKEIEILCMILLQYYCEKQKNFEFPIKILCGIGIGYDLKSGNMVKKFERMVDEYRISLRKDKTIVSLKKMEGFNDIKEKINEAINDETSFEIDESEMKKVIEQIEICQKNIRTLELNEEKYKDNMKAKSEETNLLWWMITEWSECYGKLYRDMTAMEAALVAPIEIYNLLEFRLYPYSVGQMIKKILFVTRDFSEEKYSLYDMIKAIRKELLENKMLDFNENNINGKIQPILNAMKIKEKTDNEEEWMVLFRTSSENEMKKIRMTLEEFSLRLCKELELLGCLKSEV